MRTIRYARMTVWVWVAAWLAVHSTALLAQDLAGFDVQQFNPMPSQHTNHYAVSSGHILRSGAFELGLALNYADDPLVVESADGERLESAVSSQLTLDFLGAVGFLDIIELGFDVPLIPYQDGDTITDVRQFVDRPAAEFGVGDIRIVPKFMLVTTDTLEEPGGFSLALLADLHLPTGDPLLFQGEDFRAEPRLALDVTWPKGERFSFNLGYLIRVSDAELVNAEVGSALTYGVGLNIPLGTPVVSFVPEVFGELNPSAEDIDVEELPLEILLGLKIVPVDWMLLEIGGGTGLVSGYGTPDWRAFFGLSFAYWPNLDRDGDGIANEDDRCPDDPEDFDDFEDANGCPDPDNDGDGVLDGSDQCPEDPEDIDQWEDENGCPDNDNDGDLLPDRRDQCPNDPEDVDGFEDNDGCPDIDNDNDGVRDETDLCRDDPEDIDQFEDQDGCPDPDNDDDGILDVNDSCPNEPENFNGFQDEDGCWDEELVTVTCEAVVIHDKVYFDTDSDRIQSRSFDLLDQVYRMLNARQDIRVIEVQGHTDDRGSDSYNLDLSERRAASVRAYLINRGIDPARLRSHGYGETMPVVPNTSRDNRARNRRVEFIILEQLGCQDQ